jgi:hypothetical protein
VSRHGSAVRLVLVRLAAMSVMYPMIATVPLLAGGAHAASVRRGR